ALINASRKAKEPFKVYNSDIRIHLPLLGKSVMADVAAVVVEPIFTIEEPVGLLANPTLIVEVYSKSSESYDRGDKFRKYKTLPSFEEYVLISQWEPLVETFVKKDGRWIEGETAKGLNASIHLESLGLSVSLADIYWGVTFDETDKPPKPRPKRNGSST
ncbi:MAG: Uma2 family endonuclease, partial [Bacteroidota bacterium]